MSASLVLVWFLVAAPDVGDRVASEEVPANPPVAQPSRGPDSPDAVPRLTAGRAIFLGIVEGVTEYLPVSSTGHLILAQLAMGIENSRVANAYAICIQAGAIAAVLGLYWRRVWGMVLEVLGRDELGRRMATNVVVAFLPAAVFGLLLDEMIERHLFGLWPVVFAWFVGGAVILAVAWHRRGRSPGEGFALDGLAWKGAVLIGLAQCLAMWPGTSRSLVTIVGGMRSD